MPRAAHNPGAGPVCDDLGLVVLVRAPAAPAARRVLARSFSPAARPPSRTSRARASSTDRPGFEVSVNPSLAHGAVGGVLISRNSTLSQTGTGCSISSGSGSWGSYVPATERLYRHSRLSHRTTYATSVLWAPRTGRSAGISPTRQTGRVARGGPTGRRRRPAGRIVRVVVDTAAVLPRLHASQW